MCPPWVAGCGPEGRVAPRAELSSSAVPASFGGSIPLLRPGAGGASGWDGRPCRRQGGEGRGQVVCQLLPARALPPGKKRNVPLRSRGRDWFSSRVFGSTSPTGMKAEWVNGQKPVPDSAGLVQGNKRLQAACHPVGEDPRWGGITRPEKASSQWESAEAGVGKEGQRVLGKPFQTKVSWGSDVGRF